MPFTFPIEHESPSKKKRAEQQRKIKERNHQIADIEADRKARQQNVRDKYSAPLPDQAKETKRKVADVARQKRLRQVTDAEEDARRDPNYLTLPEQKRARRDAKKEYHRIRNAGDEQAELSEVEKMHIDAAKSSKAENADVVRKGLISLTDQVNEIGNTYIPSQKESAPKSSGTKNKAQKQRKSDPSNKPFQLHEGEIEKAEKHSETIRRRAKSELTKAEREKAGKQVQREMTRLRKEKLDFSPDQLLLYALEGALDDKVKKGEMFDSSQKVRGPSFRPVRERRRKESYGDAKNRW
ncbi:MAG: hypothetical protein HN578_15370 [Rhodospirillales bacterium]|jgi:hypothetical protein|nr:hypothetical protein [Rhodospirillales bacterium]MBT3904559.1 hypothetical protein [Rhodospirillaceae bacterium]MBT5033983.1 hypothetical protein [Rhodospirillaceae bacterium]MBT6218207.1 hypothetical protein [Rhodospirillaceae bacterium]MBT6363865.1 hypothetical protein [Rhodospirillaceae bacterium]